MAGEIDGPVVKIGADASGIDTVLKSIPGKFQSLQTEIAGLGGKFEQVGQSMFKAGSYATVGITAPMAAAAGAVGLMTNQAASFSGQMGEVYTLLPNLSAEAKTKMSADVKTLSSEYGIMADDVVPALYQALSSGIPADNVMSFLGTASQTSIGGCTDLTSAVDVLSSSVNAYGSDVLSAQKASDILFTGVKMGKTNMSDLSANMSKVAPVAAALKIPLDQVVGSLDAMTLQGDPTSEAATKVKSMLAELSQEGSKSAEIFKQLAGKSFADFIKGGGTLQEALQLMAQAANASGGSIKNDFGSIEAGMAALMLTSESGSKAYTAAMDEMSKSTGAMNTAYKEMSKTAQQQLSQLKADIHNQILDIGEAFLPVLQNDILPIIKNDLVPMIKNTVIPAIKDFGDWFNKLDEPSRRAALGIGAFAAAIGPILLVLGPLVSAGGSLISGLSGISTAAAAIKGAGAASEIAAIGTAASTATPAVSGLFGLLANPVVLAAGIGIIGAYATNLGDFRDNVNDIIKDIGNAASNIQSGNYEQAGRNMAQAVSDGFETVGDLIIKGIPQANDVLNGLDSGLRSASVELGRGAGEGLHNAFDSAVNTGTATLNQFLSSISSQLTSYDWSNPGQTVGKMIGDGINSSSISVEGLCQSIENGILSHGWEGLGADIIGAIVPGMNTVGGKYTISALLGGLEGASTGSNGVSKSGQNSPVSGSIPVSVVNSATLGDSSSWSYAGKNSSPSSSSTVEDASIKKLMDERDLSYESAKKMYDSSEALRNSLASSGSAITTTTNTNVAAVNSSTQAQNQQAKTVADAIKGSASWEEASQKAAKAGFSTAEALDAWNNRYSNSESVTKSYQDTTSKATEAQKTQAETIKAASDTTAGATKATSDQTSAISSSISAINTFTDNLANADISGALSKLFSPDSTPGEVAKGKAISEEAGYTGYDANFYQNTIDAAVKAAADQVIDNSIKSGYSNGQMAYDLDQRIYSVLRKYPGASWQSNAEVQSLTDKYTSNYASDAYIDSVRNGTKAYQQATPSIQNLNQALNSFDLNSDQAVSAQKKVNDIISDGSVSLSEAASYLGNYNQVTGQSIQYSQQQIGQSQEMLSAIMQISAAQSTYSQYMSDGSLSAQEAADMNSRLAEINRLLGDAGITAQSGVSGLPGALQSLASYAQSAAASIQNAISNANAAVASANAYVSSITNSVNSSNKSTVNNTVNMSNMTFSDSYTPQRAAASALQGLIAGG